MYFLVLVRSLWSTFLGEMWLLYFFLCEVVQFIQYLYWVLKLNMFNNFKVLTTGTIYSHLEM